MSILERNACAKIRIHQKNRIVIDSKEMDSDEERDFYSWLLEAESVGLVANIEYHNRPLELSPRATTQETIQLKTKTKIVERFLLHPHQYTPDFIFSWAGGGCPFAKTSRFIWVDVKGSGSRFHDGKQFSINQKWVYDKYGIYINKVVPRKLFLKTWVPEACRYTPKRRDHVKAYIGVGNVNDYLVVSMNKK